MDGNNELTPAGRAIVGLGGALGLLAGCAAIFLLPVHGLIPGILLGMGGPVLGIAVARPIARAVTRRE
jgi:hypothetical protein